MSVGKREIFSFCETVEKKSEILKLNIVMNINELSLKPMNSNISPWCFLSIVYLYEFDWQLDFVLVFHSHVVQLRVQITVSLYVYAYYYEKKKKTIWQDSTKPGVVLYVLHANKTSLFLPGQTVAILHHGDNHSISVLKHLHFML